MANNEQDKSEMSYKKTKAPLLSPERGLGRFTEKNVVTGVESGYNTAYVNPVNRLGRPTPTKEEVEAKIQEHIAKWEKSKKK